MSANAIVKSADFNIDKAVDAWNDLFKRVTAKKRGRQMKISVTNLKNII